MMEILATGPLCSVQDMGRKGYRNLGVSTSGAMDQVALRTGNILVGNDQNAAGIEVTVFPFKVRFSGSARIAVTGADCNSKLNEKALLPWWSFDVADGDILSLSPPTSGARAYITVSGGVDVPFVLNSRSTDIKVGFGGFEGRCLRRGDVLSFTSAPGLSGSFGVFPPGDALGRATLPATERGTTFVRAVVGPEYDRFPEATRSAFWDRAWTVTPDSNRTGYRLDGHELHPSAPLSLLSHGIVSGVVQVPPNGKPIVMMSDAQTSGGYPKIATVIDADLWRLAQAPLGSKVRFMEVDIDACVEASIEVTNHLSALARSSWRGPWKQM